MPKKDLNQLAHSIMEQATNEEPKAPESVRAKAGKLGGVKGGAARAISLSPKKRSEIAKKAAKSRWKGGAVKD
jgi:hypothetical protein